MSKIDRQTTGQASKYIKHFRKLLRSNPSLKVVLYGRVSRCQQNANGNLGDQLGYLQRWIRRIGKKRNVLIEIVAEFREVASGWKKDREILIEAAKAARNLKAVLVAESACRFIRNKNYHSAKNPDVLPTDSEYETLREAAKGVTLATRFKPDTPWKKIKSYQAKRGQRIKNRPGGRPPKKFPGYKKIQREKFLDRVLDLNSKGYSVAEIKRKTGLPRSTIVDWIKKYNK